MRPTGGDGGDDDGGDDDGAADDDAADDDATSGDDDATSGDDDATPGDDDVPAAVRIVSPPDGGGVGGYVAFEVETEGDVEKVRVRVDDVTAGEAEVSGGAAVVGWDSGMVPDGPVSVTVKDPGSDAQDTVELDVSNGDLVSYVAGTGHATLSGVTATPAWFYGGLVSISYAIVGDSPGAYYLSMIEDASGDTLVDNDGDPYNDPIQVFGTESPFSVLVPNTPEVDLVEGEWAMWPLTDATSGESEIQVHVKRSWTGVEGGLLDLRCWFVSGCGLTASQAPGSATFRGILDDMQDILMQADVGFGDVDYEDISDSTLSRISDYDEYNDLLTHTSGSGRVLDLVFISRYEGSLSGVLGISGGIPGPTALHGTQYSGVAVALSGSDAETIAIAGAHEIGHYLGLFHPVETVGDYSDPLEDTADCNYPCNGNAITWNLMWPYLNGGTDLTPDQGWVVVRHPLVRLVDASELPLARPRVPRVPADLFPREPVLCGTQVLRALRDGSDR